jgi:hypothetical protein
LLICYASNPQLDNLLNYILSTRAKEGRDGRGADNGFLNRVTKAYNKSIVTNSKIVEVLVLKC